MTSDKQANSVPSGLLRSALESRTVIADGAMGTMLQAADPSLEDFQNHEGCNEILNITRPDLVRSVHDAYLAVGVDAIETNTFGANWANLAEYGIEDRIYELAFAGGKIAREAADAFSTTEKPRFVLGSLGPGTKLPSLGHTTYSHLKDAYYTASKGLVHTRFAASKGCCQWCPSSSNGIKARCRCHCTSNRGNNRNDVAWF
ncbi:MAG: hypothetical protein RLZ23_1416 [Actinomycetota bacterium]